jgi:hypothetical protein
VQTKSEKPTPAAVSDFDNLPGSAIVQTSVTSRITGLSERTIRNHPKLPRTYTSTDRYGQRVSDIRDLLTNGMPPDEVRIRVSPRARDLVSQVQSAPSRAEGEQIIATFDRGRMSDGEYERLQTLLQDALAELPEDAR